MGQETVVEEKGMTVKQFEIESWETEVQGSTLVVGLVIDQTGSPRVKGNEDKVCLAYLKLSHRLERLWSKFSWTARKHETELRDFPTVYSCVKKQPPTVVIVCVKAQWTRIGYGVFDWRGWQNVCIREGLGKDMSLSGEAEYLEDA